MNPTYEELLAAHTELLKKNQALESENQKRARAVASLSLENGTNEYKRIQAENDRAHDPLTKLLNRRGGEEMFDKMLSAAKRDGRLVGMILIDLDHFKNVNDTYGHAAGDVVLREVAQRMALRKDDKVLREEDIAMRWGGEEFAILFTTENAINAASIAERLRSSIANEPVNVRDENSKELKLNITASFGVTVCDPNDIKCTTKDMASQADAALYESKNNGRDCITLFVNDKKADARKKTVFHPDRPKAKPAVLTQEEIKFFRG